MDPKVILDKLQKSIEEMDTQMAEESAREAVEAGIDPLVAINDGLSKGMETMSDLFDEGEVFVPHLLVASEAFEGAVAILTESMSDEMKNSVSQGKVLIHTVQGDIHDIGKNIVKTMLSASGFQVIDMGRDVPVEDVIEKAKECKVDIIVGSALMTTTMPAQRDIINLLQEEGIRDQFMCMFGGAPVSSEWVEKIGADGYSESASGAVKAAKELMVKKRG
ncbi:corrinoid protein [Clostridium sp. WILCCON 0269]|uniref:Corrinoid protein n=1 Tax=Candidatus Clostridium eludens TaxID=3381663 RepID=A0ABW8SG27_9CLOT